MRAGAVRRLVLFNGDAVTKTRRERQALEIFFYRTDRTFCDSSLENEWAGE